MKGYCLLLLLVTAIKASGQDTYHHGVFWGRLILADSISGKLKWELYLQNRTQNIPEESDIFATPHFRSAWFWINYNLAKNLKLSVSPIGYFESYPFLSKPADVNLPGIKEFRWTLRLEQESKFKIFNFSNRYSLEYRRRDLNNDEVYLPNWRIRYMAKLEKPVKGILSKDKPVSFYVSDEIFIQFGKAVRNNPNVFDQNRIAAGFSYEVLRNIKVTISYLNIIQERNSGRDFDDAHTVWVVLLFDNVFSQFRRSKQFAYILPRNKLSECACRGDGSD